MLLEKIEEVEEMFEKSTFNSTTASPDGTQPFGAIASGVCSLYARDALEARTLTGWQLLSLVTTHPLPTQLVRQFVEGVDTVLVVEEVDPFVEDGVRILDTVHQIGTKILGKRTGDLPSWGEMNTDLVSDALRRICGLTLERGEEVNDAGRDVSDLLIERPLTFCPGCTHRNVFWALRKVRQRLGGRLIIAGDIGCYSLGVFYDGAMDTMQAMGSGIGTAIGIAQMRKFGLNTPVVALAGDSTFFHACIPALINARHINANLTLILLDNQTTAMTGFQPHPGVANRSGQLTAVDIRKLVESIGPDIYVHADGEDVKGLIETIHGTVRMDGLKVVHVQGICYLQKQQQGNLTPKWIRVFIDESLCQGTRCKICVQQYRCTAMVWDNKRNRPAIIEEQCVRCGSCIDVCPHGAIVGE